MKRRTLCVLGIGVLLVAGLVAVATQPLPPPLSQQNGPWSSCVMYLTVFTDYHIWEAEWGGIKDFGGGVYRVTVLYPSMGRARQCVVVDHGSGLLDVGVVDLGFPYPTQRR